MPIVVLQYARLEEVERVMAAVRAHGFRPEPAAALNDGAQSPTPKRFEALLKRLREIPR